MINKIISIILITFSLQTHAIEKLDNIRPENISEAKWASLQEVIVKSKLFPTPEGVGGMSSRYGESVSIDGNRALIGSPTALEHGVAYILDYDGSTWVETQTIIPNDLVASANRFGISVSLQGDRALIGDLFNQENGNQSGAAYIYELNNGNWIQTKKLLASDGGSSDQFGISVSLSTDRALIGATDYDDSTNGTNSGAAYVFDYDGSDWQESVILTATAGSSGDQLGISVSLEGDKALVGSSQYDDNNNGINTGSAYLFELNVGMWSQAHQFLASDGVDADKYGIAVSLSTNRVLIGASDTDENFSTSGAAYVYEYDGSMWIETKLLAPDAAQADRFGVAVTIENDRLLVGARNGGDVLTPSTGSAYIYDYDNGLNMWQFTQEIFADDIINNNFFASSLGLSGDKVIIGNFNDNDNGSQSGAAYVFDLDGTWQQSQKLATQGAVDDNFGYAVSLDGNRALIGAPYDDNDNGSNAGNAYIFDYVNGQWSSPIKLQASEYFQNFGMSVSLSGTTAIIGANVIDFAGTGRAYVFEFDGSTWIETTILQSDVNQSDEFGFSVNISGDRALVGAPFYSENGIRSGATFVYELIAGTWQQTDNLIPSDGQSEDFFGGSVSLFADRILIGAYTKDDDIGGLSRAGAAYIYDYDSMSDMWIETKLQVSDPHANDFLGSSVDLDNNRAIVGARNGFGTSAQTGSAYIFNYDTVTNVWSDTKILASDSSGLDLFGVSVSLHGNRALVGAYNTRDNNVRSGSVYLYEYDGNDWNEVIKYIPQDAAERDNYGFSVSLSGSMALIGSYQDDDRGTDSGTAYTIIDVDVLFSDGFED